MHKTMNTCTLNMPTELTAGPPHGTNILTGDRLVVNITFID